MPFSCDHAATASSCAAVLVFLFLLFYLISDLSLGIKFRFPSRAAFETLLVPKIGPWELGV